MINECRYLRCLRLLESMHQDASNDFSDNEADKLQVAVLTAPTVDAHNAKAVGDLAYLLPAVCITLVVDDGVRPVLVLKACLAEQDTVVHRIRQDPPDGLAPDICSRNLGAS